MNDPIFPRYLPPPPSYDAHVRAWVIYRLKPMLEASIRQAIGSNPTADPKLDVDVDISQPMLEQALARDGVDATLQRLCCGTIVCVVLKHRPPSAASVTYDPDPNRWLN